MGRKMVIVSVGLLLTLSACAPPTTATAGSLPTLFVANAADRTVSRLDLATGRLAGPPLPTGVSPEQLGPGPDGTLLILSVTPTYGRELSQLIPTGARTNPWTHWTARALPLGDPVSPPLEEAFLAADGGRWAAIAYQRANAPVLAGTAAESRAHEAQDIREGPTVEVSQAGGGAEVPPQVSACGVAMIDVVAGLLIRARSLCNAGDLLRGVAVDSDSGRGMVYVAIQGAGSHTDASGAEGAPHAGQIGGNRLLALDAATGQVVAGRALAGTPTHLLVGSSPDAARRIVFCLEASGGPEQDVPTSYAGRLLALDGEGLAALASYPFDLAPARLALAPDGGELYALFGQSLSALDLRTGAWRRPVTLPERGVAIAATDARLYVASGYRNELWVLDRRSPVGAKTVAVGNGPVAIACTVAGTALC